MLTAERHRLEHAAAPIRREMPRHIRWVEPWFELWIEIIEEGERRR